MSSDSPDGGDGPISFAAVVASDPVPETEAGHAAPTAPLEDPAPAVPTDEVIEEWPTPAEAEETETDTPPTPTPAAVVPRASQQPTPAAQPPSAAGSSTADAAAPSVTPAAGSEAATSGGAAKVPPKGLGAALRKPKGRKADASSSPAAGNSSATSAADGNSQPRSKGLGNAGSKASGGSGASESSGRGLNLKDLGFTLDDLDVDHGPEDSSEWESASEDEGSAAVSGATKPTGRAGRPAPASRACAEAQRAKEGAVAWAASFTDMFDRSTLIVCSAVLGTCAAGLLLLGARAAVRR